PSTGRPWHAFRTPAMIFVRLNGSVTPLRLTTASTASSTVVNRRPHSGQDRRRRMICPSSASRESTTRESACRQYGHRIRWTFSQVYAGYVRINDRRTPNGRPRCWLRRETTVSKDDCRIHYQWTTYTPVTTTSRGRRYADAYARASQSPIPTRLCRASLPGDRRRPVVAAGQTRLSMPRQDQALTGVAPVAVQVVETTDVLHRRLPAAPARVTA